MGVDRSYEYLWWGQTDGHNMRSNEKGLQTYGVKSLEVFLKGLSHEIFRPVFFYWPVWMHLGLNKNLFWFLNFKEAPSI